MILFFSESLVALADRRGEIANAAADDEAVIVAHVVRCKHRDAEGAGLIVEELLSERIASGDEFAEALSFVAGGAGRFVERMVGPLGEREAIFQLMGEAAE